MAKIKLPTSTPPQTTPGKSAKSRYTESAIEEPLFQERGIDSLYNVSGQKDRFQMVNPEGSSLKKLSNNRDSSAGLFQMDNNYDYEQGAFASDYDVSGLFHMADQAMGNRTYREELFSKEKIKDGIATKELKDANRMADSIILLDKLENLYTDKFEQKGNIKNYDTTLNRTQVLQESGFLHQAENTSTNQPHQTSMYDISLAQNKRLNKRIISDESTMLPTTDMKISFGGDASVIVGGIDWSKFQVTLLGQEDTSETPLIAADDKDVTNALVSILRSASKLRNDTTFGRPEGDSEDIERMRQNSGFKDTSNLLNQITFSKPNLGVDPINHLSTINENMTDEMFGTLMPGYQAGLGDWDYLERIEDVQDVPFANDIMDDGIFSEEVEERCSKMLNLSMIQSKRVPFITNTYGVEFDSLVPNLTLEPQKRDDPDIKVDMVQAIQYFLKMAMNNQIAIHQENVLSVSPVYLCDL